MNIVCAGDCGVDRYVDLGVDRPGGKTLNTAVTARRLFDPADRIAVVTAASLAAGAHAAAESIRRIGAF